MYLWRIFKQQERLYIFIFIFINLLFALQYLDDLCTNASLMLCKLISSYHKTDSCICCVVPLYGWPRYDVEGLAYF